MPFSYELNHNMIANSSGINNALSSVTDVTVAYIPGSIHDSCIIGSSIDCARYCINPHLDRDTDFAFYLGLS